MHIKVVEVLFISWLVFFSGETNQSLVVDVDSKRVASSYQGVDSEIELQAFVEEGVVDVGLYHTLPIPLDFSDIFI